jgi:hypothetical protein
MCVWCVYVQHPDFNPCRRSTTPMCVCRGVAIRFGPMTDSFHTYTRRTEAAVWIYTYYYYYYYYYCYSGRKRTRDRCTRVRVCVCAIIVSCFLTLASATVMYNDFFSSLSPPLSFYIYIYIYLSSLLTPLFVGGVRFHGYVIIKK